MHHEATVQHDTGEGVLLYPADAARRIGVAERTLADWRRRGTGPDWIKVGSRTVRYPARALGAWLSERTVRQGGR